MNKNIVTPISEHNDCSFFSGICPLVCLAALIIVWSIPLVYTLQILFRRIVVHKNYYYGFYNFHS